MMATKRPEGKDWRYYFLLLVGIYFCLQVFAVLTIGVSSLFYSFFEMRAIPYWLCAIFDYLPHFISGILVGIMSAYLAFFCRFTNISILGIGLVTFCAFFQLFIERSYEIEGASIWYYISLIFLSSAGATIGVFLFKFLRMLQSAKSTTIR